MPKLDDHGACRILRRMIASKGYVPTFREIAVETGLTPAGVQSLLERLADRGFIERNPGEARAFTLTDKDLPVELRDVKFVFMPSTQIREGDLQQTVVAKIYDMFTRLQGDQADVLEAKTAFRITIQRL